jgi:Mg-chelatase subunit ChlI
MAQRLRGQRSGAPNPIRVRLHDQLFLEAADRLAAASLLPLSGDLTAMEIVRAFQRYRGLNESTSRSPVYYFESAVRLLAWTGRTDEGRRLLATYVHELSSGCEFTDAPDDLEAWEQSLRDVLANPDSVRKTAAAQAVALKVDRLPLSSLL